MPNRNHNNKIGFRDLSWFLRLLVTVPGTVLLIWIIALQNAVSDAFDSTNAALNASGDFLVKRFSLDPKKNDLPGGVDFEFGFGIPSFADIWHFFVQISPLILILMLAFFVIQKIRSSRRRPHRPAPSSTSSS